MKHGRVLSLGGIDHVYVYMSLDVCAIRTIPSWYRSRPAQDKPRDHRDYPYAIDQD